MEIAVDVAGRVLGARQVVEKAQEQSPLAAKRVILLAASKAQSAESILAAVRAGITDFGENRVQEAQGKWPEIKVLFPDLRLHLIGPLQSNKVKEAVALFDVIQTLDREKLVDALSQEMDRQGRRLPCYIQVNTGAEPQKSGVLPGDAAALAAYARRAGLELAGLMCVPPVSQHPAPHFALLAALAEEIGVCGLSMGMSGDFETAVRMGATCVRLGRTLFGERQA